MTVDVDAGLANQITVPNQDVLLLDWDRHRSWHCANGSVIMVIRARCFVALFAQFLCLCATELR